MLPPLSHRYADLPEHMRAEVYPTPVPKPRLVALNRPLAEDLGMELACFDEARAAELFSGNALPEELKPTAAAYAGHQFGNFVPQLGDGRALLLGEARNRAGQLRDIQLKGSGRTPFSRGGDGRAPLGPVLREYLVSEAMHALGVPTTRALAATTTGERVYRRMPEPGAVLTRVASSHLRVGTFQYFAVRGDEAALRVLVDEAIVRHYPELAELAADAQPMALLEAVIERQAKLIAKWMSVGFIHGVMNTDNCAIGGETIDYGPCAFMDRYDPMTVFSSIDGRGRYAYANQPSMAQWNLARFAEAILPLMGHDSKQAIAEATEVLETFNERYQRHWLSAMRHKLGLSTAQDADAVLAADLLEVMHQGSADFTLTFHYLAGAVTPEGAEQLVAVFDQPKDIEAWLVRWRQRLGDEQASAKEVFERMCAVNPAVIPRNHRVEQVIEAASERDDFAPFNALLAAVTHPFDASNECVDFRQPPLDGEQVLRTFCGT
ncbi:protein adenylyltransferase SelO [Halomonas halocynthiae]|uniref:protein adenylyltransferase SelO n=1 Tax=Halomonas halocynthiae TaxID=176290 RepID=UPI00042A3938|nr:YdiU family protein [Halomonas halocynthiae]